MKKLHSFVIKSILGPFIVIITVLVFIFLVQFLVNYMDELAGKGIGPSFFAELSFYFSFKMIPKSMPIAVLLASLMAYGNLGQFNELTAIKSAGISLPRIMVSSFWFFVGMAIFSFLLSNYIIPKTNLKAYSLFYDIRHKEATFDLQEKVFSSSLPGYSIRVDKKYEDGKSLKNVIVYSHSGSQGNRDVMIADSGQMYTIMDEKYLVFKMFNGTKNTETKDGSDGAISSNRNNASKKGYAISRFDSSQMVFDMSSFKMDDTPEELFKKDKRMLRVEQLVVFVDSIDKRSEKLLNDIGGRVKRQHVYYSKAIDSTQLQEIGSNDSVLLHVLNAKITKIDTGKVCRAAATNAKNCFNSIESMNENHERVVKSRKNYEIAMWQKITEAFACIVMFLIGAPIGSIIKKGGLGIPVLVGVLFFIIYYILTESMRKYAKEDVLEPEIALWIPNIILFIVSMWFLNKARKDARLFELDGFQVLVRKLWAKIKPIEEATE
ncbi:MAG: LptF/LptG family permease [Cyclobacteriaceae bacterium]